MANRKPSQEKLDAVLSTMRRLKNQAAVSEEMGIPRSTIRDWLRLAGYDPCEEEKKKQFTVENAGNSQYIHSIDSRIKTVDEALAKANVDTAIWEMEKNTINSWEVGMKVKRGDADAVEVVPLWQVKVWLRRKVSKAAEFASNGLIKRMERYSPKYPRLTYKTPQDPHMLEVSLFDAHFAKLCWGPETGSNYDLKIAETVYSNAVQDLLARTAQWNIEKFLFPIGQDFFHMNNKNNTTVSGRPMDVDGRYEKVFEVGVWAVIKAIEQCLAIGPVEVPYVRGNHDAEMSWHLAREVAVHFRRCKHVTVDFSPNKRKVVQYGANGIMITHGDTEKHSDLPITMAAENRELWGNTTYCEIHTGHYHKKKDVYFVGADTFGGGIVVRTLPSLSGPDQYHHAHGWNNTARAAEAYVWGKNPGLAGYFSVMARDSKARGAA